MAELHTSHIQLLFSLLKNLALRPLIFSLSLVPTPLLPILFFFLAGLEPMTYHFKHCFVDTNSRGPLSSRCLPGESPNAGPRQPYLLCANPSRHASNPQWASGPLGKGTHPSCMAANVLAARVLGRGDATVGSSWGAADGLDVPMNFWHERPDRRSPHSLHGWGLLAPFSGFLGADNLAWRRPTQAANVMLKHVAATLKKKKQVEFLLTCILFNPVYLKHYHFNVQMI